MSSMMGSSKYEFEPELFEKDLKDRKDTGDKFADELKEVIYKDYMYKYGGKLSNKAKREILINIHKVFLEDKGFIKDGVVL